MASVRGILERSVAVLLLGALGACGGGGGGSNGILSLSTDTLTFSAAGTGATPPGQVVKATILGVSGGTVFIRIVATGRAVRSISDISITGPTTGEATVFPASASVLGVGRFTSTITVTACTTDISCSGPLIGTPQTINVTYNIPGVVASPASLSYGVGYTPFAGDPIRQISVTGFPDQDWTASVDVPWLSVVPGSGNARGAVQLTATLVQPVVDALFNGTRSGSITITPSSGAPVTVPVALTISRTQVNYISPYIGISGVSARAIVRGNNFDKVTITGLKIGPGISLACPSAECALASDTEIDIVYPALAAGTYPVQLVDDEGITTSFADLVVVDAPVFPPARIIPSSLSSNASLRSLAYDAARKAFVLGLQTAFTDASGRFDPMPSGLLRFSYATEWRQEPPAKTLDLQDASMTPDGRQWLMLGSTFVAPVDASTLAVGETSMAPVGNVFDITTYNDRFTKMAMTNDGKAVLTVSGYGSAVSAPVYLFDSPGPALASASPFSRLQVSGGTPFGIIPGELDSAVSEDGSLVALPTPFFGSPVYRYSASTATLSATGLKQGEVRNSFGSIPRPVVDRNGMRIAIVLPSAQNPFIAAGAAVYDQSFTLLGNLPLSFAAAFRPDPLGASTRVYTLSQDRDIGCRIHAFDLTSTIDGNFAEITGTNYPIPLFCVGQVDEFPKMTFTPDGGTLFIAGSGAIEVVPVPDLIPLPPGGE